MDVPIGLWTRLVVGADQLGLSPEELLETALDLWDELGGEWLASSRYVPADTWGSES